MKARTVLVTGAGSGIGAAVVVAAGSQGASVAAVDLNAEQLDRVVAQAAQAGASDVLALEADVRSEHAVQEALARCCERLGVPTAVLANAGIEVTAAAHEIPLQEWNRTIEVNLAGAFLTARHAIREMLREGVGGSVVCTSFSRCVRRLRGG